MYRLVCGWVVHVGVLLPLGWVWLRGILCVCVHVCEKTEQEEGVFEMAKCDWSVPCWATNYAEIGYSTIRLFHIHHFSLYVKCGKLFWWSFKEIFGETQKAKVRKKQCVLLSCLCVSKTAIRKEQLKATLIKRAGRNNSTVLNLFFVESRSYPQKKKHSHQVSNTVCRQSLLLFNKLD